ncbi:MAG: M28 family peptidase [Flavobacteriales bacterium]|nr:M28 family peptidase [Flavobacteriales bacterium]
MRTSHIWTVALLLVAVSAFTACSSENANWSEDPSMPHSEQEQIALLTMRGDVGTLTQPAMEGRETGTRGADMAGQWLSGRMIQSSLSAAGDSGYFQNFVYTPHPAVQVHGNVDENGQVQDKALGQALVLPIEGFNVLGASNASAGSWGVIGAHYDHLGWGDENSLFRPEQDEDSLQIHPGADDNASGVAVMLELARRNKLSPLASHAVLFAGFSGEEKGLWGSNHFCDEPTLAMDSVRWMLNFDMVGRMHGDTLAVYGVGTSPVWPAMLDSCNTAGLHFVVTESGVGPSDHTSFYYEDVPVLHFFTGQHPDYHRPSDTAEKLNQEGMLAVADLAQCLVAELDNLVEVPFTATVDTTAEPNPDFKVTLGVMPDYMFSGSGMRIDGVNPGRPAKGAGMERGDVVVKMGDLEIVDMMSYMKGLSLFEPGQSTKVQVLRGGELLTLDVTWD